MQYESSETVDVIQNIQKCIRLSDNFLITSHINPDGDSLSSVLVIANLLSFLEKKYQIFIDDQVPAKYDFLPGIDKVLTLNNSIKLNPETCIVLDASNIERIGNMKEIVTSGSQIINIDHHADNDLYGHHNWIVGSESSTVELAYHLLKTFKVPVNYDIATLVYMGIVCDTGRFRFPNTTQQSLQTCVDMIERGVQPHIIAENMYYKKNPHSLKVLGKALQRISLHFNDKIGTMYVTLQDLINCSDADTEGFVEYLQSIQNTEINFFINEVEAGVQRISLRSKTDFDVSQIARLFGGGGHQRAAGCTVKGEPEEVIKRLIESIEEQYSKPSCCNN